MSAERLVALKASAARSRLRVELIAGRMPPDRQAQPRDLRKFPEGTLPNIDHRLASQFKRHGQP